MAMSDEAVPTAQFSLAERDSRWRRVRALMERDGLDVIVVPPHTGHHDHFSANARYLTGLGGFSLEVGAVFPLVGEVTAVTVPDVSPPQWRARQDWIADIRSLRREFGDCIITRLHELTPKPARIGLAGLGEVPRFADGLVPQRFYARLQQAFPNAALIDCTHLIDEARYVKSEEEIAFLQQGVVLAEAAIAALRQTARPGVSEAAVYARMLASMIERGGEVPTMIMWAVGTPDSLEASMPTRRRLAPGEVMRVEVEGRWAGYVGQVTQMAMLGTMPADYREMFALQQEAVQQCWDRLRPGVTLGELGALTEAVGQGTPYQTRLLMHSRGLGDDSPIYIFAAGDEIKRTVVAENSVFIVKPVVMKGPGSPFVCWGDCVVATPNGARRLGTLTPEIIEL
jgi:Xaa-Pro aminopeptidase